MKSKGIKNLLIDLGGVLINLDRQRWMENFKNLGFTDVALSEVRAPKRGCIAGYPEPGRTPDATGKRIDNTCRIP